MANITDTGVLALRDVVNFTEVFGIDNIIAMVLIMLAVVAITRNTSRMVKVGTAMMFAFMSVGLHVGGLTKVLIIFGYIVVIFKSGVMSTLLVNSTQVVGRTFASGIKRIRINQARGRIIKSINEKNLKDFKPKIENYEIEMPKYRIEKAKEKNYGGVKREPTLGTGVKIHKTAPIKLSLPKMMTKKEFKKSLKTRHDKKLINMTNSTYNALTKVVDEVKKKNKRNKN